MKKVPLAEIKDQLSRFLHDAEREEILITRHGKPAGILIGFESEDDWFDYKLENDPRFLDRIERARTSLRAGHGVPLEALDDNGAPIEKSARNAARSGRKSTPRKRRQSRGG